MDMIDRRALSSIRSPCSVHRVRSCGEESIQIVFEYQYLKIRDYGDDKYEVMTYVRGGNYSADFPSTIHVVPKCRIDEYLSRF